jgi:Golgi phosphoprotein 3
MERSVAELFVLLALNPDKGRIGLSDIPFRYSLTGALLMEYHERGEFTIENKRVIPAFRNNGEKVHDLFAEKIMKPTRNKRLTYWISNLTNKSRLVFREIISILEKDRIIRIEPKKFLFLIPYKRYWFIDISSRNAMIENLRGILLYGKKPGNKELMLLGLVEASKAYQMLSREKGESKELRKRNTELLKGDNISAEISQTIREVQAAIIASVIAASVAANSGR